MICGLLENMGNISGRLRLVAALLLGTLDFVILWLSVGSGVYAQRETHWVTHSFRDFAEGELGSGGANLYVSRRGSVQMINLFDLNRDGYLDILFNQSHDFSTS